MTSTANTNYRSVRVETCLEAKPHTESVWALFAYYPNEFEAYEAVSCALVEYPSARLIVEQQFSRKVVS